MTDISRDVPDARVSGRRATGDLDFAAEVSRCPRWRSARLARDA